VEVLYGPGSTIYGSDALGGVVHVHSKIPKLSATGKLLSSGSSFTRYSSANDEKTGHIDISLGAGKLAWLQSYTYSDFGDMKMGKNYPDKYPAFGRRDSMIAFFGFKDSVVVNPDPEVQRYSGYKQWDILQKLLFKPSGKFSHLLNFQYSNTTDVPRYDRLQDKRNFGGSAGTTLRYAEWFYGPQERIMAAYEFNASDLGFLKDLKAIVSFQDIKESRQQREYRRYDRFDSRKEKVKVWGFVIDGRKFFGKNELTFGIDGQFNDVTSRATRTNLTTGAVSKLDTRYPDGENRVNYLGVYGFHIWKSGNGKWILNDGIRLQAVHLTSQVIDNSFFSLPVTGFEQKNFAVTGNLGIVYLPSEKTRAALSFSSGFRSPNLDDLVKIFDFSVAKRVYVPNAEIDPEYTYNTDLTITHRLAKKIRLELTGFYTLFRRAIVSAPFQLNGQDSILYNGVMSAVYANQNRNKAKLYGFNVNVRMDIIDHLSFNSTASYTHGTIQKFDGSELPQDHIPPFFGKTGFLYQQEQFSLELYSLYNGWKKIKDYNPDGEDNQQYATPDGMPSWFTLNWRGSVTICKDLLLQAGVENILDRNYRYFASGFSAPGRNFILALRAGW
jgi:hemoglobin/transferrin/lactoferrin receptor protein